MKIGIIGIGQIGATLVQQYSRAGHYVKMANASGPEKLKTIEAETGAKAVPLTEIANGIEVLVVSIPLIEIPQLANVLRQRISTDTIIIDTTNYYPIRDGRIEDIENGMVESVWVSKHLSQPVIKVYNSILAGSLAQSGLPKGSASRIALPISGDNEQAKQIAAALLNDTGFDAVDIGNLFDSWRQQPGSPIYCTDVSLTQLQRNAVRAQKTLLPERREKSLRFILEQNPVQWRSWWKECVASNRLIFQTDLNE